MVVSQNIYKHDDTQLGHLLPDIIVIESEGHAHVPHQPPNTVKRQFNKDCDFLEAASSAQLNIYVNQSLI